MKIYNEAGQLSEEGKKATEPFREVVSSLLATTNDPNEMAITASLLKSIIGDMTTYRMFPGAEKFLAKLKEKK
jgi:hypothetical protein